MHLRKGPFLAVLLAACGGSYRTATSAPSSGGVTASGYFITISNLTYSPLNLAVPPGATVTVMNDDGMLHSVTSESAPGAFTPGSVAGVSFDTGEFASGTSSFTVPASAANGTIIPYYCTFHKAGMMTPNGTITVSTSAAPSPAPAPTPPPMPGM